MSLPLFLRRTMPTIIEGNLHFDFPAGWLAVKYDEEQGFYRDTVTRHIQYIRGVDIVACPTDEVGRLLFIEAKDYRKASGIADTLNSELLETMLRKTLGTLAGLTVAERVQEPSLHRLAILSRQPAIEVVLFLVDKPLTAVAAPPTSKKLRRQTQATGRNDLEQKLTAILADWGLSFKLRGSPIPLQPASNATDEWTVRLK